MIVPTLRVGMISGRGLLADLSDSFGQQIQTRRINPCHVSPA